MLKADLLLTLFLLFVFAWCGYEALSFPWEAGAAPLMACGGGLLLCLIQLKDMYLRRSDRSDEALYSYSDVHAILLFFGLVCLVTLFGFLWGGWISTFIFMLIKTRYALTKSLLLSLPIFPLIIGQDVIDIHLYAGIFELPIPNVLRFFS